MSDNTLLHRQQTPLLSRIVPPVRTPVLWLALLAVLVTLTLLLASRWAVQSKAPVSADLFMQSVAKRDGKLGWQQLCPSLQAQMPLSALTSQLKQQRSAEAKEGLRLSVDYVGAHPRAQGGQIRLYVVTAHRADGWVGQRTYVVWTQASGCVEDVNNS